jgi:hypothetical protein
MNSPDETTMTDDELQMMLRTRDLDDEGGIAQ